MNEGKTVFVQYKLTRQDYKRWQKGVIMSLLLANGNIASMTTKLSLQGTKSNIWARLD